MTETCGWCGRPARGYARIGEQAFCHEGEAPTCYMLALWERSLGKDGVQDIARHILNHLQNDEEVALCGSCGRHLPCRHCAN